MIDYKIFLNTLATFYSIGYSLAFLGCLVTKSKLTKDSFGWLDIIFFIWAFATALAKATK